MLGVVVTLLWATHYSGALLLYILTAKSKRSITEQYTAHSSATITPSIICVDSLINVSLNLYAFYANLQALIGQPIAT